MTDDKSLVSLFTMRRATSAMLEEATIHLEMMKNQEINKGTVANIRKLAIKHIELSRSYQTQLYNWRNNTHASQYLGGIISMEEDVAQIIKLSKDILASSDIPSF